jgi:flavin reductase (DIM6/NTAB) family NADH-FMN oxidoreductase RutF
MKVNPSLVHRLFYPQVPLVMAARFGKRVSAMPVVSYASVSEIPPLVAVACNPEGFTCKLALKSGAFSLCVLDREHAEQIGRLATVHGGGVQDKLADAGLKHTRGTKLNVPLIDDAVASLECALKSRRKHGDHLLLVGEVKAANAADSFVEFWDFRRYKPLLYTGWRGGLTTYPRS